jgi:hypothetical protein
LDAAKNTVSFLAELYASCGEPGQQLVNSVFEQIKAGKPQEGASGPVGVS